MELCSIGMEARSIRACGLESSALMGKSYLCE